MFADIWCFRVYGGANSLTPAGGGADNPQTVATPVRTTPPRPLGQILLEARVISIEVLQEALPRTKTGRARLGEVLLAIGAASQEDVLRALAIQQGILYLGPEELPSTLPLLKNLSPKYLRQYLACPITVEGSTVTVRSEE